LKDDKGEKEGYEGNCGSLRTQAKEKKKHTHEEEKKSPCVYFLLACDEKKRKNNDTEIVGSTHTKKAPFST
jgi:hypothetical protein